MLAYSNLFLMEIEEDGFNNIIRDFRFDIIRLWKVVNGWLIIFVQR